MTMLTFRADDAEAADLKRWAAALGVGHSELLRQALHRQLVALRSREEAATWEQHPATGGERALEAVADWGPAEDWSDWRDAAR